MDLDQELTDTKIYRYFRKFGNCGIDGIILYLSEEFSFDHIQSNIETWTIILEKCAQFLDAWFNRFDEIIKPEKIISGNQLSEILNIPAGPKIGIIKEAITEAQIEKKISTFDEAVAFAKQFLLDTVR